MPDIKACDPTRHARSVSTTRTWPERLPHIRFSEVDGEVAVPKARRWIRLDARVLEPLRKLGAGGPWLLAPGERLVSKHAVLHSCSACV